MEFTLFADHRDKGTDRHVTLDWAAVARHLSTHTERPDKVGPGFSPAKFLHTPCQCGKPACTFMRGHAIAANVVEVYAFMLDLDKGWDGQTLTEAEARQHLATIAGKGVAFVAHTSYSYAPPEVSTWRVLIPFSRPVLPGEFKRVWKAAKAWLGVPSGIRQDFASRFWNSPSCPPGAPRDVVSQTGPHLDVELMLSLAVDDGAVDDDREISDLESPYGPADEGLITVVCEALDALGPALEGQGGDPKTYAVARTLVNDFALSEAEAWPIFEAWNAKMCLPPWEAAGLSHKMAEALAAPPVDYGQKREAFEFLRTLEARLRPPPGSFGAELEIARAMWAEAMVQEEKPVEPTPWFMTAGELLAMEFPATPWLIKGLVTRGGVGTIATEPKAGKTWAATEYCLAVASGTPCFGEYETQQGAAAYFYAEDMGQHVKTRLNVLGKGRDYEGRFYPQPRGKELNLCDDASVVMLLASLRRIPDLKLLVLDPLRDIHTGAEDSSDEMSQVTKRLRVLSGLLGCTVIFVHHTAKGGGDVNGRRHGQRMRGSGAIHGAVDHALYMYDATLEDGKIINTCAPELKGAKAAGTFVLTLHVEDDPETQTAISARWAVSAPGESCDDEGIVEVIDVIGNCLMRKEDPPMERDLHKALGGSRAALTKSLAAAEAMGYVARHKLGQVSKGWILTAQGHTLFNGINAAAGIPGTPQA